MNKKLTLLIAIIIVAVLIVGTFSYILVFSPDARYEAQIEAGNKFLSEQNYEDATIAFEKAIKINPESIIAKMGASKAYVAIGGFDNAQRLLKEVINVDANNEEAYNQLLKVLILSGKTDESNKLLSELKEKKIRIEDGIKPEPPTADLESGTYDEIKTVNLIAEEGANIFYTTDGNPPSEKSIPYTQEIQLQNGQNLIKAIAIKESGIYSDISEWEYSCPMIVLDNTIFDCLGKSPDYIERKMGKYQGSFSDGGGNNFIFGNFEGGFWFNGDTDHYKDIQGLSMGYIGVLNDLIKFPTSQIKVDDLDVLFSQKGESYFNDEIDDYSLAYSYKGKFSVTIESTKRETPIYGNSRIAVHRIDTSNETQ